MTNEAVALIVRSRGGFIESIHQGSAIALTANGYTSFAVGDCARRILPRSTIKLVHALPFLASGAADLPGAIAREIVLSASSHIATPAHLMALEDWARRLGVEPVHIRCGPDMPLSARGSGHKPEAGSLTAFHNNNAGKHLGIVATCLHLGEPIDAYPAPDHPAMLRLADATRRFCDVDRPAELLVENCGLPTWPMPLSALALGMARLADPAGMEREDQAAAARLCEAIGEHPDFLAGPRRLPTEIARVTRGRVIAKGGSEGIYAACDRRSGLGFALKIDDGSGEAASAAILALLAACGAVDAEEHATLARFTGFWNHPFAPERSPDIAFPFLDRFSAR